MLVEREVAKVSLLLPNIPQNAESLQYEACEDYLCLRDTHKEDSASSSSFLPTHPLPFAPWPGVIFLASSVASPILL